MPAAAFALALLLLGVAAPPGAAAQQEQPHDFARIGCAHCHIQPPGAGRTGARVVFRRSIDDLCQECHGAALEDTLNHRVGVRPSMPVPEDLRLSERGELSCITCHDPHTEYRSAKTGARTYFLRRQMQKRELCVACHAEESFREPRSSLTLLAPITNTVVDTLPVPLIGTVSDERIREVTVEINETRIVLDVRRRAFSTLLKLQEGINSVRVLAGDGQPVALNVLYNPGLPKGMTYRLYRSHGMLSRRDCFVCHSENSPGWAIGAADAALCAKCHERPSSARFVHGPVAVGSCTVCHDPHGQTNASLLLRAGEELCFQCHAEADVLRHLVGKGDGGGEFLRAKGCTSCHDPHQAERKYLLRSPS